MTYQVDRGRSGWIANETALTPDLVKGGSFGPTWDSPQFNSTVIGSTTYVPKMYASSLYIDSVTLSSGTYAGRSFSTIIAATSNGFIYAVDAFPVQGVPAGTILWQSKLTNPEVVPSLDGGVPMGVLSTPIVDVSTTPARVYVASDDAVAGWRVFALDLTSGSLAVRQGCSTQSSSDRSLLPPTGQSQFHGALGPLNVFGPYSEQYTNLDYGKSRSTPAYFKGADNTSYLFVTGSTKQAINSQVSVSPDIARLKVILNPAQPAYLATDLLQNTTTMVCPGSPLVTSNGSRVGVSNLVMTPAYPPNDGIGFETYSMTFASITGDAIRLIGTPGGSAFFISVGELQVYGHYPCMDRATDCS